MTGIIDIGSNTIRLVMYDRRKRVSNIGLNSEIINDTVNGRLTSEGTQKLCRAISFLKEKAEGNEIFAFATYAFRILENREEVKRTVFEKTGVEIDILSGKEEAEYDFYGLKSTLSDKESGIGVDLGGGSAQIFCFEKGELIFSSSYPIGCKRLKNRLVRDKFPTDEETAKVEKLVREQLAEFNGKTNKLYMMGGTAKTAIKLYTFLNSMENMDIMKTESLSGLVRFIEETPEDVMKNVLKNRYDNIVVGIIIMKILAEICGAEEIHIKKCGVRDGYLLKKKQ